MVGGIRPERVRRRSSKIGFAVTFGRTMGNKCRSNPTVGNTSAPLLTAYQLTNYRSPVLSRRSISAVGRHCRRKNTAVSSNRYETFYEASDGSVSRCPSFDYTHRQRFVGSCVPPLVVWFHFVYTEFRFSTTKFRLRNGRPLIFTRTAVTDTRHHDFRVLSIGRPRLATLGEPT